ncbi:hypothetical protein LJC38_00150 [Parabacteroides sp. OttesenSCG-928-K15]|nr:hypothetical protein [Parabacteroides sp. OttesenSCG-928-K15]
MKIIEIQNLVLDAKRRGVTQIWVYENQVRDKYFISLATFNNYLSRNARKELSELNKRNLAANNQLNLFSDQSAV